MLTVAVAVALPLAVSLAASLVYLVRSRLARWLAAGRCCRRHAPGGAQVHPQPPTVYTVPATANGAPRSGQGHGETTNQNGRTANGENGRQGPRRGVNLQRSGPLVSQRETKSRPSASDDVRRSATNAPATSHTAPVPAGDRSPAPPGYREMSAADSEAPQKRPARREQPARPSAAEHCSWPWWAAALALYVACGALAVGLWRRLDAGAALLAALLAVTGGHVPAPDRPGAAAAAALLYAALGMVLTGTLCASAVRAVRAAAIRAP